MRFPCLKFHSGCVLRTKTYNIKNVNKVTCFHNSGRNVHNNINVIIPNKRKNHWSIPVVEKRSRGTILTVRHLPTILIAPSTNCKDQKKRVFGGALMMLQNEFQFRLIDNHFFLIKCQQPCISDGRRWNMILRWLYLNIRAIFINRLTVHMSGG